MSNARTVGQFGVGVLAAWSRRPLVGTCLRALRSTSGPVISEAKAAGKGRRQPCPQVGQERGRGEIRTAFARRSQFAQGPRAKELADQYFPSETLVPSSCR